MTLAEFLAWEERQELRYEFDGVAPEAMAGGTVGLATIQGNVAVAVGGRLRGKPCRFYGSDLKIRVADDHVRYPDGMVMCSGADPRAKIIPEQDRIGATVHVRIPNGWSVLVLKEDDELVMPEIDLTIPLAEFYEGLTFDDHPVEDNDNDRVPTGG